MLISKCLVQVILEKHKYYPELFTISVQCINTAVYNITELLLMSTDYKPEQTAH